MIKRIPARGATEHDAFARKWRRRGWLVFRAGVRAWAKRSYSRRFRRQARLEIGA